jgi:hypothetical protein
LTPYSIFKWNYILHSMMSTDIIVYKQSTVVLLQHHFKLNGWVSKQHGFKGLELIDYCSDARSRSSQHFGTVTSIVALHILSSCTYTLWFHHWHPIGINLSLMTKDEGSTLPSMGMHVTIYWTLQPKWCCKCCKTLLYSFEWYNWCYIGTYDTIL